MGQKKPLGVAGFHHVLPPHAGALRYPRVSPANLLGSNALSAVTLVTRGLPPLPCAPLCIFLWLLCWVSGRMCPPMRPRCESTLSHETAPHNVWIPGTTRCPQRGLWEGWSVARKQLDASSHREWETQTVTHEKRINPCQADPVPFGSSLGSPRLSKMGARPCLYCC